MRVVADSNIYISALLFAGFPSVLLERAQTGKIDLFISQPILDEVLTVMRREKFKRTEAQVQEAREIIEGCTQRVEPTEMVYVVTADPSDNKIIECALAAKADVIVSGDKHLLRLKEHAGIPIMKVWDSLLVNLKER